MSSNSLESISASSSSLASIFCAGLLLLGGCGADDADTMSGADCAPSGGYDFVCGLPNAEDLVAVPDTAWVLASAMVPGEAIYLIDSQSRDFTPAWPSANARTDFDAATYSPCPGEPDLGEFITHGLNIRRDASGALRLYAVSHGAREAIEAFAVDTSGETPVLTWIGCVPMPEGLEANSVTSSADGTLIATVLLHPGSTFEQSMAGIATGAVYQWAPGDPGFRIIIGTELPANNGIEIAADETELYVVSSGLRTVVAYDRRDPARLLRTTEPMPIIPDNIHRRADGSLITAGTIVDVPECGGLPNPAEFDIEAYAACPRGFIALSIDPRTMQFTTLARGAANPAFSNATMALEIDDDVWVGTFSGDRIGIVNAGR